MGRGFITDIENMRQEDTQYALFHINRTPELLKQYLELKSKHHNKKTNSIIGLDIANKWAYKHNNTFGDLFQTELELVRWNKLLKLL